MRGGGYRAATVVLPSVASSAPPEREVCHVLDLAPDSGAPLLVLVLLTPKALARVACVKRSWRQLVFQYRDVLWPPHARRYVHSANVWIRATRFNAARCYEDNIPGALEFLDWMEEPPPEAFLASAPAYAVAKTHECIRDRRLLKHYAPLNEDEEDALLSPADEFAVRTLMETPGGYAGYLVGCGCLESEDEKWSSSWVQWSVDALECLAGLVCSGYISLSLLVPVSLREEDDTKFETADSMGREQTLLEWLAEHTGHYGEARMRKLIALSRSKAAV